MQKKIKANLKAAAIETTLAALQGYLVKFEGEFWGGRMKAKKKHVHIQRDFTRIYYEMERKREIE